VTATFLLRLGVLLPRPVLPRLRPKPAEMFSNLNGVKMLIRLHEWRYLNLKQLSLLPDSELIVESSPIALLVVQNTHHACSSSSQVKFHQCMWRRAPSTAPNFTHPSLSLPSSFSVIEGVLLAPTLSYGHHRRSPSKPAFPPPHLLIFSCQQYPLSPSHPASMSQASTSSLPGMDD
jgi:hypothetical protein